jgi:hypothetical protein
LSEANPGGAAVIKVGQHKRAKYWGGYTVEKVAMLSKPVQVHSQEVDKALFNPTLVKIEWDQEDFHHEFWFPYWITLNDAKEKYGQFAPMMGEGTLLELLREAIRQDFFTKDFLDQLHEATASRSQTS